MSYHPLVNIAGGGLVIKATNSTNLAALDIRYVNQSGDMIQGDKDEIRINMKLKMLVHQKMITQWLIKRTWMIIS